MMLHNTIAQLRTLKLDGLASGLEEQLAQASMSALSFEERLALLVDRENQAHDRAPVDAARGPGVDIFDARLAVLQARLFEQAYQLAVIAVVRLPVDQ